MKKVKLKDIASFSKGKQINGDDLVDDGKYEFLNGGINPSGKWHEYNVEGNSIAISEGGNSCGYVNYMDKPFWCGAHCYFLYDIKYDAKYIYYALKSQQDSIMQLRSGACMPNIKKNALGEFTFSIEEDSTKQALAVASLDKVSELIALRKKQLAKLDQLVKSRFIELFGDPEQNTKGWPIHPLGELCSVGSSKRIYQNEQSPDGVPFWRISDLVSKMDTGTAGGDLYIPAEKYLELKAVGLVPVAGDILVTSRGTLGRCYIIKAEDCFYFQDGMISWLSKYSDGITPLYLQYLFTMSGFRKQIDSMQAGSTVAYLSIAMLKKLQTMVPSKDTQEQFAAFVEQTDKSKLAIQQSLDKLELLKKSLMQEYFG